VKRLRSIDRLYIAIAVTVIVLWGLLVPLLF
jgi:hypothetical protein